MDRKIVILIAILALILVLAAFLLVIFGPRNVTGEVIISEYSYTKAICNESNYCEDYEVVCSGGVLKQLNPTGHVAQFQEDWVDERESKNFDGLC